MAGNSFSDRPAGSMVYTQNFARRQKLNREPLGVAPAPEEIPAQRNVAEREAEITSRGGTGSGIVSPLTEKSRIVQTVRVYDPADATRWIDVEQVVELVVEDAEAQEFTLTLVPGE